MKNVSLLLPFPGPTKVGKMMTLNPKKRQNYILLRFSQLDTKAPVDHSVPGRWLGCKGFPGKENFEDCRTRVP